MTEYELLYFNGKGRGELIRLVFAAAKKDYTDTRIEGEKWMELKPKMPNKALPVLKIKEGKTEKMLCQSGAIARYLATEFGLGGKNSLETAQIDEVMGCIDDAFIALVQSMFGEDDSQKAAAKKQLTEKHIPNLIEYLNKRLVAQKNNFLVGDKLSLADIATFSFIDMLKENKATYFDGQHELDQFYEKVKACDGIKTYQAKQEQAKK